MTTPFRESRDFHWAAVTLATDSTISSRVERFRVTASFALIPSQGSSDLPKEAKFESGMPPGSCHLSLWLMTGQLTALETSKM